MHFFTGVPRDTVTKTLRIVRITSIILLAGFLHVSARTSGQTVTLSVKDAPIKTVFKEIQKQTGLNILVDEALIVNAPKVTMDVHDMPVSDALQIALGTNKLNYRILDGSIIITEKKLEQATNEKQSPPIDIHGRITLENGDPADGATIVIKGTKISTTSDVNGVFALKGVDPNAIIVISFVGHETAEIPLRNRTAITHQLKLGLTSMNDVTIHKGYYDVKQRFNTGDVTKVDAETIERQPVTDPIHALEGQVAGLDIAQTSGVNGAYSVVRIRGENTLTTGSNKPITANDPLYIVDGVPFSSMSLTSPYSPTGSTSLINDPTGAPGQGLSPFNSINPMDIESVEVLKDADATAIYGSRGTNGVILITTKKGKSGKLRTDFNLSTGQSQIARKFDLLNTPQYLQMRREAFANDGRTPNIIIAPDLLLWDTTSYTNWQKILIENPAMFSRANISLSGGNENTQILVRGGFSSQGTTMPGDYKDQIASFHTSIISSSLDKKFRLAFSGSYSNDNNNLPQENLVNSILISPDAPTPFKTDGELNFVFFPGTTSTSYQNPFLYTRQTSQSITDYYQGDLKLSYLVLKGLNLSANMGFNHSQLNYTFYSPLTAQDPSPANQVSSNRAANYSTTNSRGWIIEPQVNYSKDLGSVHMDVLAGMTFHANSYDSRGINASDFPSDILIPNIQAASVISIVGSTSSEYHYEAIYARAGIIWKDKYLLNLTGRRDGSSRFGPNQQFGNFGAIGAGWIFSEEKWIKEELSWLNFAKVRGSYGITGNDNIGDYNFLSVYQTTGQNYQGVAGLQPTGLANNNYHWEHSKKLELAIDLGLLKDRVHLSTDWYRNQTDDQLVQYPLPSMTGFTSVTANLPAVLQNTGWEFMLNTVNVRTKNFIWATTANLSIPRSKLVSFPGIETTPYFYSYFVGYPLETKQVLHYVGVDPQTGLYQIATKDGSGKNITYPSGNNVIGGDYSLSKPVTRLWYGGMNNSFSFNGFQLNIFIQFVKQWGYSYLRSFVTPAGTFLTGRPEADYNRPADVLNSWQKPGDNSPYQRFTNRISGTVSSLFQNYRQSDAEIVDASYIRVKNVSLSYNLPKTWFSKLPSASCQLYIQCENLFTLTHYNGLDPESQGGVQSFNMPPMRTIVGGIQFGF